jgi:CheY-like chemotaxis protein
MEIDSGCQTRILVVDDEQLIANTLAALLNLSGFKACPVYSGEEALVAVESFKPDVVISDVIMSGMTGIEAAIAIRSERPSCKILLFSGQAATNDLLHDARAQGHDFELISKPVHPNTLLAKLRSEDMNENFPT